MKNLLLTLLCCLFSTVFCLAQDNPGFSYQAVARDANGMIMASQKLDLRLAIIQDNTGTGNGTLIFRERHQPTTNEYGLFNLIVGKGDSLMGDFQKMDWTKMNLYLQVEIDIDLDQTYTFMGKTRILPVPLALHAMTADDVDDADADPTNEIQFLAYDSLSNSIQLTGANSIQLPRQFTGNDSDTDPQNEIQVLTQNGLNVTLSEGGGSISVADNDNNPNNELQSLSRVGDQITLSAGGGSFIDQTQDADADASNEIQILSFDASTSVLQLSNGGGQVDLTPLKNTATGSGTDDQQLSLNGTILSIEDGNSIDLANLPKNDADADPQNELQQMTFDTTTYILRLSDGGQVDLSTLKSFGNDGTTQSLSLTGTSLGITGGNTVDLSTLPDQVDDADADPQNELQILSFDTTSFQLSLSDGNQVNLSALKNFGNGGTTQSLSLTGTTLGITGGNTIDLSTLPDLVDDADADPLNEIQAISFDTTSNLLTLSNGGVVDLSTLKNNGSIPLPQNLSLNGTILEISDGNQVDLSSLPDLVDDADADETNELQVLTLTGDDLQISNGNSVNLAGLNKDDADADPQNELQQLTLDTTTNLLQLSENGGSIDLSYLKNTVNSTNNNQTLQLNGKDLSISDGNTVSLDSLSSPWDIKPGYIEYLKGKTRVEELYTQNGDTTVSLNTRALLFDEVPGVIGDETIVDHQGIRSFETLTEYSQLNADSLYFTYAPDLIANYRDVRESSFTPEKLSIKDSLEVSSLTKNALKFDYSEFPGDYAYYGHDSLSFAYNYNLLLPFFSNMDANKLEFWSVGGESKHYAGASEHYIADDSLVVSAFGIVNKGNSANTAYDRFRLEANDFTMRNDARWTTFDFITPANTNATTFKMYPGTGLSEYFTLGPSPFDPLSAQLTMQTDGLRSVCLAGHDGVGQLCLYDHGVTAFQMTAQGVFGGAEFTMFDTTELIAAQMYVNINNHPEFEMNTGIFRINNTQQAEAVTITTVNDGGQMTLYGPNGFANTSAGGFFNPNHGYSTVNGSNGLPNAWMLSSENGGMIQVFDTSFIEKVNIFAENNAGKQTFFGSNGQPNIQMGTFGNVDRGFIGVNNENGTGLATLSVVDNGGALVLSKSNSDPGINAFVNGDNQSELDIFDGLFRMYDSRRFVGIEASSLNGFGTQKFFGENGNLNVAITEAVSSTDHGLISIYDENELNQVGLAATDNGGALLLRRKDGTYSVDALVNSSDNVQMSVYGGEMAVRTKDNFPAVVSSSVNGFGEQKIYGANGKLNFAVENGFNSEDHGQISIYDENELNQVGLAATDNGGALLLRRKDGTYSVDALVNGSDNVNMSIYGGSLNVRTKTNFPAISASSQNGFGELDLYGGDNQAFMTIGASGASNNNGHLFLNNSSGSTAMGLTSNDNGGVFFVSNTNSFATISNTFDDNDRIILDISSGDLKVNSGEVGVFENNEKKASIYTFGGTGQMVLNGANGNTNVALGTFPFFGDLNRGYLAVNGTDGAAQAYLTSNGNGGQLVINNSSNQNRAGIFTNEFGQGVSYADVKNFKMDHPQDETKEIWYASLEGPEAAAYERGTATLENGTAFIPFTEHYQLVANAETMTVLVTPLSAESTGLAVVKKTDKGFYVKELFKGKGTYQFDWEVKSVRKGYENFEVIRDKKN